MLFAKSCGDYHTTGVGPRPGAEVPAVEIHTYSLPPATADDDYKSVRLELRVIS